MALVPGTRLGPFEVTGTLGAGGMGEVYRARDDRLGRDVAIKVLPDVFTSDADRIARFEREARVLASLNHPNIAAIYGVEEGLSDSGRSVRGLVLELVEGETLAERLARRPMVLADALDIAGQIVEALETAHDRGIVHRDLKSANIKITSEGIVKVLDFGLAKSATSEPGAQSRLETAVADGTRDGMILGTAAYMSPEQARGQAVDKRTDIWAFGCVLFEMLTGRLAFEGATMTDTLAAIVEREPQWTLLPAPTPASVRQLLKACLVKDAKRRLRDIGDTRFGLKGVDPEVEGPTPVSQAWTMRRRLTVGVAAIAVIAGSLAVGMTLGRPVRAGTNPIVRLAVPPPPETQFAYDSERIAFALSPDGRQLGFVTDVAGATRIWVRPLSSDVARPVPGTEGARSFMWSPNGAAIAFFVGDKLKRMDLSGGVAVVVCDAPAAVGIHGSWSVNDEIVFASVEGDAIYKVAIAGGTPTPIVKPELARGEARVVWPSFLPDGRRVVFVTRFTEGPGQLSVGGDGRAPRHIAPFFSPAQWVDPHYLVFAKEGTLVAQRFDSTTERLMGAPVPIADSVEHTVSTYKAGFSASRSGTLVYQPSFDVDHLVRVDRAGAGAVRVGTPGFYQSLRLSRDARRLMFDRVDPRVGTHDVWIRDLERGTENRITSETPSEAWPVWIDGERAVVFMSARGGPPNLFRKDLASGQEQLLTSVSTLQQPSDISPDERTMAFMQRTSRGNFDIWTLSLTGAPTPTPLLTTPFDEVGLRFSPDGRAMAWTSDETGTREVYVASPTLSEAKIRVSQNGGGLPRWSRDGRELFYLAAEGRIMAVPMRTTPKLTVGTPTALFTATGRGWRNFEVAADGRFLAIERHIAANAQPLNVVLNWMGDGAR